MARVRSSFSTSILRFNPLLLVLAFGLVALAVACDSGTQEPDAPAPAESEYGALPAESGDEAAETTPIEIPGDGSIPAERFPTELPKGVTAEIPSNFPSTIPVYPGAQPALGKGVDREDGTGTGGVQFVSNDSPPEIFAFYESKLEENGWKITKSQNDASVGALSLENETGAAELFMMASPMGGTDIFMVFEGRK